MYRETLALTNLKVNEVSCAFSCYGIAHIIDFHTPVALLVHPNLLITSFSNCFSTLYYYSKYRYHLFPSNYLHRIPNEHTLYIHFKKEHKLDLAIRFFIIAIFFITLWLAIIKFIDNFYWFCEWWFFSKKILIIKIWPYLVRHGFRVDLRHCVLNQEFNSNFFS